MPVSALTTVIPAFNEGDRLFTFLQDWASTGAPHTSLQVTALVVDDGSRQQEGDRQRQAVEAAADLLRGAGAPHDIRYLRADRNRGKGASIRWGWSQADPGADWLSFIDADGALPAREYWRLAAGLPGTLADVVCGSRVRMAGHTVERSMFRHLQGRVFATAVEELFHLGFYDTQCGMKFFRASVLRPVLPLLQEDRWLLDVEVLARLRDAGARFVEVPVDCYQHGGSSLAILDPMKMLMRLVRLRRQMRGPRGRTA